MKITGDDYKDVEEMEEQLKNGYLNEDKENNPEERCQNTGQAEMKQQNKFNKSKQLSQEQSESWLSQYIIDALGISDREKLNNHKKQKEISNMKKDDDDVLLGGLNSKNNINEEISKDLLLEKNYEKKNVKRKNILKSINQALK
ncbi:5562_t:CDS:2 [Entrophospora sp. SA101]|nr:5562_t:CDS:2 [Entrophospora sp. SA101]